MCIAAEMLYISKWLQTVSLMFEIFNVTYIIISTQKLCFDCVIILVSYAAEMSQYLPLKIGENLKVLKAFMNLHFNNFVVY